MSDIAADHLAGRVDLDACEDEPIRIPGAVQPHGVLLAMDDDDDLRIRTVSANLATFAGLCDPPVRDVSTLVGQELRAVIGEGPAARIAEARRERWTVRREVLGLNPDQGLHATLHRSGDLLVAEVERDRSDINATHAVTRDAALALHQSGTVLGTAAEAARAMRQLTGFDRVMVYGFDSDWHGEVIAEERREDLNTFLGLHYPSTDIPPQARELYRTNWIRAIADVSYRPVPLVPVVDPASGEPFDLSGAVFRSVSPVHLEYLANMGVTASMSVSIIIDNELWGLVACHHYSGMLLPTPATRSAAEYLGRLVSARIQEAVASERRTRSLGLSSIVDRLSDSFARLPGHALRDALRSHEDDIVALTGAGGAIVSLGNEIISLGQVPGPGFVEALEGCWADDADLLVSDRAGERWPELRAYTADAAGILALSITGDRRDSIVWVRPELVRTLDWAGDPYEKERRAERPTDRLSPRRSFDLWRETIRGRSHAWQEDEISGAYRLAHHLSAALLRRDRDARALADDLQRIMLPERMPEHESVRFDAYYSPDGRGQVGGDWYDVFAPDATTVAMIVGDVTGHGLQAASAMAQARNSLRAYLVDDPDPALALGRLSRMMQRTMRGMFATAAVGVIDTDAARLTLAVAGHPPPVLAGSGRTAFVDAPPNVLLGYRDVTYEDVVVPLSSGDRIVLYTDGLIETRSDPLDARLRLLLATIEAIESSPGGERNHARAIASTMLDNRAIEDDVTVLTCEVR